MDPVDLIQGEIDGENSPDESAWIREHLEKDASARVLYEDLLKLSSLLSRVESIDPPEDLKRSILSEIDASRKAFGAAAGQLYLNKRWSLKLPILKYGYIFASGLILGALVFSVYVRQVRERPFSGFPELFGTMIHKDLSEDLPVVDQVQLKSEGMSGTVLLRASGTNAVLDFDLISTSDSEVLVEFDPEHIRFLGLFQPANQVHQFYASQDKIRWSMRGRHHARILFTRESRMQTRLRLQILAHGSTLYTGSLELKGSG